VTPNASLEFEEGDPLIARLGGEIDIANAGPFGDQLRTRASGPGRGLVVDCSGVGFMDSSGIRMLLGVARHTEERERSMVVVVPEGSSLWRILDIAGLGDLLAIEPTVEAARARLPA
jgi:anti-sigma B factor antagonist